MSRVLAFFLAALLCVPALGQTTQGRRKVVDFRINNLSGLPEVLMGNTGGQWRDLATESASADLALTPLEFDIRDYRGTGADLQIQIGDAASWIDWATIQPFVVAGSGGGATTAAAVSYANATSGLTAANVQAALDEIVAEQGTNNVASAAPTATDDDSGGYAPGSLWIDDSTTPATAYVAQDATTGAAVWLPLNQPEVIENAGALAGAAPTGAKFGIDTTTGNIYRVDAGNWAAIPSSGALSNVNAGAPTATDDSGAGYSIGSIWFDTSTSPDSTVYVAQDVTAGAAVWRTTSDQSDNEVVHAAAATLVDKQKNFITAAVAANSTFTLPEIGPDVDRGTSLRVSIANTGNPQDLAVQGADALNGVTTLQPGYVYTIAAASENAWSVSGGPSTSGISADANNILTLGSDTLPELTMDPTAFAWNLATSDTTLQNVVDKFDDHFSSVTYTAAGEIAVKRYNHLTSTVPANSTFTLPQIGGGNAVRGDRLVVVPSIVGGVQNLDTAGPDQYSDGSTSVALQSGYAYTAIASGGTTWSITGGPSSASLIGNTYHGLATDGTATVRWTAVATTDALPTVAIVSGVGTATVTTTNGTLMSAAMYLAPNNGISGTGQCNMIFVGDGFTGDNTTRYADVQPIVDPASVGGGSYANTHSTVTGPNSTAGAYDTYQVNGLINGVNYLMKLDF